MGEAFWPAVVVGVFFVWIVYVAVDLEVPAFLAKWYREPGNSVRAMTWVGSLFIVLITFTSPEKSVLDSLRTDAITIAVTVIVIEELGRYRAALEEKERIMRQMASHSNEFALDAVRLVRENNWHKDGSLCGKRFNGANLTGASLSVANLTGADLSGAILQKADLESTKMVRANLSFTYVVEANLLGAKLAGANLAEANLTEAYLVKANLVGAYLVGTNLASVNLAFANLAQADLSGADLTGANLAFANLVGANLLGANLASVNLAGANLVRASLDTTNISPDRLEVLELFSMDQKASLREAVYSLKTTWPEGFDPKSAGAILVE